MKVRFKKFSEFVNGITIAYGDTGCKIICNLQNYVLLDVKFKPWSSPKTRQIFLAKMYMNEVLAKANPSKKIQRIEGYQYLGKRVMYRDQLSIICDAIEMVDPETGDMTTQIKIFNSRLSHPLKVFINEVQL